MRFASKVFVIDPKQIQNRTSNIFLRKNTKMNNELNHNKLGLPLSLRRYTRVATLRKIKNRDLLSRLMTMKIKDVSNCKSLLGSIDTVL